MDIPFKLILKTGFNFNNEYKNIDFFTSLEEINNKNFETKLEIVENNDVSLKIISDYDVKVEMDGFDGVFVDEIKHKDGYYLTIKNKEIKVFTFDNFPLPPGEYILSVEVLRKKYYTVFKVKPSQVEEQDWQYMVDLVLDRLKILALDIIRKKIFVTKGNAIETINSELWLKMQIINSSFNKVMGTLDDLVTKPHNKISKKYISCDYNEIIQEDRKSNKLNAKSKNQINYQVGLKKYIDYDLSENRYIKKIILELDNLILAFLNEVSEQHKFLQGSINKNIYQTNRDISANQRNKEAIDLLEDFKSKGRKINYIINILKSTEWFKNIKTNSYDRISVQSLLDPRYNILSKLSKDLKNNNIKYNTDNLFAFLYKRTDKLYEVYGFLKIFDVLINLGFEVESSLKTDKINNEIKIFGLEEGDIFILKKDDLKIKLVYDAILSNKSEETDKENPLYTKGRHNRPDGRMDCFINIENDYYYAGSLIIDFKYRKKNSFWSSGNNNSQEQLRQYRNDITSKFYLNWSIEDSVDKRVAQEVWVLYPDRYDPNKLDVEIDDKIKFLSFVPQHEAFIDERIEEFVNYVKKDAWKKFKWNKLNVDAGYEVKGVKTL